MILRWFLGLFKVCEHKWEIIKECRVEHEYYSCTRYHLQCKKCGNVKCEDMK